MTWQLVHQKNTYPIENFSKLTIGKDASAGLQLDSPYVSRQHLMISLNDGVLTVEDLGSKNGTIIESKELAPHKPVEITQSANIEIAGRYEILLKKEKADQQSEAPNLDADVIERISKACSLSLDLAKQKLLNDPDRSLAFCIEEVIEGNISLKSFEEEIRNEYIQFGHIQKLMDDSTVSEILINGPGEIWVEIDGELRLTELRFYTDEGLSTFVERSLRKINKQVDRLNPYACGRLPDGSRITVLAGTIVHSGIHVSIRKYNRSFNALSVLVKNQSVTGDGAVILKNLVQDKKNIIIAGGTGSGKTTLLTALIQEIPLEQRVIVIEDTSEIFVDRRNFIRCEAREENSEGRGEVSIRDLFRHSLRLRPDRLMVGECRGEETIDLLQALNTGHSGSMSTIHANSTREAIGRLELLCLLAKERIDPLVARRYISNSLDYVVQMSKVNNKRKVSMISRLAGLEAEQILLETVYRSE